MFPLQKAMRKAKNSSNGGLLPRNVLYPYIALVSVSYITYFFYPDAKPSYRRYGGGNKVLGMDGIYFP